MFQRICKQAISSNQCIAKFPYIADIKHFSSSITYFKKELITDLHFIKEECIVFKTESRNLSLNQQQVRQAVSKE